MCPGVQSMQFNVVSLLKEPTGSIREYDLDDDLLVDRERHHVTGHVRLDRTNIGILVRASLAGTLASDCSRCLRPVSSDVAIAFEEEYLPTVDPHTGLPVTPPEGMEDAYRIDRRHMLDLALAAQQYWSLSAPMAPVCSDGCRGLCPDCGADLNAGEHACGTTPVDARWEKLARLRES